MEPDKLDILRKHGYVITGRGSGVKLCHWVGRKLVDGRACYKEVFYGIECHRCMQMSPCIDLCNQKCLFCWRYQGMGPAKGKVEFDEPVEIVDRCLEGQRELVSGFRGDNRVSEKMWQEARNPNQVAVSLAGEPTMYPYLGELIRELHRRKMTVFLVTNGTAPEALKRLEHLPDQLYVTLAAPNQRVYQRLCIPDTPGQWKNLMETLDILPGLNTRTVIRHTLVAHWNIGWEREYAELISRAEPDFVEAKGYVFVGDSRRRMNLSNMPSHDTVKEFALKEAEFLGLDLLMEKADSRVVLLGEKNSRLSVS